MFSNIGMKSISLSGILGGISKVLNLANQIIPIYNQAKPMINNSKKILNVVKEFTTSDTSKQINNSKDNKSINIQNKQKSDLLNRPVFFN